MIYPLYSKIPNIDPSVYHWQITRRLQAMLQLVPNRPFGSIPVIRGDVSPTIIGRKVNIQDLCCLHQSPNSRLFWKMK